MIKAYVYQLGLQKHLDLRYLYIPIQSDNFKHILLQGLERTGSKEACYWLLRKYAPNNLWWNCDTWLEGMTLFDEKSYLQIYKVWYDGMH